MLTKVFIDGQEGTTGLKIYERFKERTDIEIIRIDESLRKDVNERKSLINQSDYTFLCLPDAAAVEAVSLIENDNVKIIDASTAHRTNSQWVYGLPELNKNQRESIANSKRVAVPGCYASGFNSIIYPLIACEIINADYPVTCHAVSGYSGAGKKAIEVYEGDDKPFEFNSPRQYALGQEHKHLNEMQVISGLKYKPVFNPIVDDYFSGMVVSIPLISRLLAKKVSLVELHSALSCYYKDEHFIKVMPINGEGALDNGFVGANNLANTNDMQIFVCGNDERMTISARLDNLGKGASGAAVQCMNIMMGIDEKIGLMNFERKD